MMFNLFFLLLVHQTDCFDAESLHLSIGHKVDDHFYGLFKGKEIAAALVTSKTIYSKPGPLSGIMVRLGQPYMRPGEDGFDRAYNTYEECE